MGRPLAVSLRKTWRRFSPAREPDFVVVDDATGRAGRDQNIPRVVFQTAESRLVHPTHYKSIQEFRELNDDLDFVFLDRDQRDDYMKSEWGNHPIFDVYSRALYGQMKADMFRYCVVYDRGGYYVDFNKGIGARITDFHTPDARGLISYETNPELLFPADEVAKQLQNPFNLVMQWAFGFERHHPFLDLLINRIVEIEPYFRDKVFRYPKSALLTMSAPGVFTQAFRDYVSRHGVEGIAEAGEDFFGHGIFRLRGSKFLWKDGQHYDSDRDKPLIHGPSSPPKP